MMRSLSIGNVINVSLKIYLHRLKQYLLLALTAHLWLLVPIYGWAKFAAISATISRLVLGELLDQRESFPLVRNEVNRQMWLLLISNILVTVISFGAAILAFLLLFIVILIVIIVVVIFLALLQVTSISNTQIPYWIGLSLAMLFYLLTPLAILWVYSRLFITELPLVIENNMNAVKTIKRSWQLTKKMLQQIQGVMAIAFLVTLPLLGIDFILLRLAAFILRILPLSDSNYYMASYYILAIIILFNGIICMPFWQATKAVLYYDLKSRKEGFDLQVNNLTN